MPWSFGKHVRVFKVIKDHLKLEFQKRLNLSAESFDSHSACHIQVNDRFSVRCQFAGSSFILSCEIGDTALWKNKLEALKELLQGMTRKLPAILEVLSIDPESGQLTMRRVVRKPTMLAQLEEALAEFVNTYEFLEPIYHSHT